MMHKYETDYSGPSPKSIDPLYPDHTYEEVVCLVNGELKKIIQDRYLRKLGYTKQSYLQKFPGAPTKSKLATENYRKSALNDGGRRSNNMRNLNLSDSAFQKSRKRGFEEFLQSDRSIEYRKNAKDRALEQHANGHADYVREYFANRYQGSTDQENRKKRMAGKNNIIYIPGVVEKGKQTYIKNHNSGFHATRKKQFKHYDLRYQSSYEYDFLEHCEQNNLIHLVKNPMTLKDDLYPRRYYLPDFILDSKYIVEIKSWYIEERQLQLNPNVTVEKKQLVERLGYKWLYLLDKNYTDFNSLFGI